MKDNGFNTCFICSGDMNEEKCRACGAERQISQVTGNVIWIRNGRVLVAFQDEKEQWVSMAKKNGIPEWRWPERFQTIK